MDTFDAIKSRRSIKSFQNHQVTKDEINQLLEAAVLSQRHTTFRTGDLL
jgi:nitroreductase